MKIAFGKHAELFEAAEKCIFETVDPTCPHCGESKYNHVFNLRLASFNCGYKPFGEPEPDRSLEILPEAAVGLARAYALSIDKAIIGLCTPKEEDELA